MDTLGNTEAPQTTTINIDLTPPHLTATLAGAVLPGGGYAAPVTVTLAGRDNLSGLDYRQIDWHDGHGWQTMTGPVIMSAAGRHTLAYRAVDRAGNVSEANVITVAIDAPSPSKGKIYLPLIFKLFASP